MAAPTLKDFTIYRGALTRQAASSVPISALMVDSDGGSAITGWSVTATGGTAAHWTITQTDATPTPSAAGVAAQLSDGAYSFSVTAMNGDGTSAAKTLTVSIRANTYTVSSPADVSGTSSTRSIAKLADRTVLSGKTIELAKGSEAAWAVNNGGATLGTNGLFTMKSFNAQAGRILITSEDTSYASLTDNNWTTLSGIYIQSCQRIDIRYLNFEAWILSYSDRGPCNIDGTNTGEIPSCGVPQKSGRMIQVLANATAGPCSDITIRYFHCGAPADKDTSQYVRGWFVSGVEGTPLVYCSDIQISDGYCNRVFSAGVISVAHDVTVERMRAERFTNNAVGITGSGCYNILYQDSVHGRTLVDIGLPTDHVDFGQSGVNHPSAGYNNCTYRRIIAFMADGLGRAQGVGYLDDISFASTGVLSGYSQDNWTLENNFSLVIADQGMHLDRGNGYSVQRNTILRDDPPAVEADGRWATPLMQAFETSYVGTSGVTGTVANNVVMKTDVDIQAYFPSGVGVTLPPLPGTVTTTGPCSAALQAFYAPYFNNPVTTDIDYDGLTLDEIADILRVRFAPILGGPLMNTGPDNYGTYNGAFFPDGSWNDGTVYGASMPTAYTAGAQQSTVSAGQPDTITYQLNAPAAAAVTITPGVSGVSGSFSPATVVIGIGSSTGTTDFTPTTAGTASLTSTNDRSLANPSPVLVTVAAAPAGPTLYTQRFIGASVVPLFGSFNILYELDLPAIAAVTITPACTLAGAFLTGSTVVIPFGSTTATATFAPHASGIAVFTASDDSGLTDPASIEGAVTTCNVAQLVALGIRA